MKQLGSFALEFSDRKPGSLRHSRKTIDIELFLDEDSTIVEVDCSCCPELLTNRLPGGILIPIASTMKLFFEAHGLRNIGVRVRGSTMTRKYRGHLDPQFIGEMKDLLQESIDEFSRKRHTH